MSAPLPRESVACLHTSLHTLYGFHLTRRLAVMRRWYATQPDRRLALAHVSCREAIPNECGQRALEPSCNALKRSRNCGGCQRSREILFTACKVMDQDAPASEEV